MPEATLPQSDVETVELTYVDNKGAVERLAATVGDSLMQVATYNGIDGIDADCGGSCACGTCRVYLDEHLKGKVPAAEEDELAVLEFVADGDREARLGCQVRVTSDFHNASIKVAT